MLLAAFLDTFEQLPPEKYRTLGASSAGHCGRRLAYAHFPERFVPEKMTARRRARLMAGRAFEDLVLGTALKALPATTAGETAFLWPIPVDEETMNRALIKSGQGRLLAHIVTDFNPNDIMRWRVECLTKGFSRLSGVILDPQRNIVFIPALADAIGDLAADPQFARQKYALFTADFKTMSTAGFRHVVRGALDYGYRTQFAIQADAANLDTHVGFYYRLETSHAVEVIYSKLTDRIRATFHLSNGSTHTTEQLAEPKTEWDEATIEHPFQAHLLEQARDRIRAVLRSTADDLPPREYGPDFTCRKCQGTGAKRNRCGYCDGDGLARRSKNSKAVLEGKRLAEPCKRCERGKLKCPGCKGAGILTDVALGFPCGWCPFLSSCYVNAAGELLYELKLEPRFGGRPAFVVSRETYLASGLTFAHPEKP